jgi:hypothetical protein
MYFDPYNGNEGAAARTLTSNGALARPPLVTTIRAVPNILSSGDSTFTCVGLT